MSDRQPLVSACMLTGKDDGRIEMARRAVTCFMRQDWPNKELIIVNHNPRKVVMTDPMRAVTGKGHRVITEILIDRESMGRMRQKYVQHASGEFCIQWDDDDFSPPDRIREQVRPMLQDRKVGATLLDAQVRYSLHSNCALIGWNRRNAGIDGTIAWRRLDEQGEPYSYPDVTSGEDSVFRRHFRNQVFIPDPRLYFRMHHGGNIMGERFIMYHLTGKADIWELQPELARMLESLLGMYMNRVPRSRTLRAPQGVPVDLVRRIRSRTGLVFQGYDA